MPKMKAQIQRICECCGKPFTAKTLYSKYCSRRCSDISYKQRKKQAAIDDRLKLAASKIPDGRAFVSIQEAVSMFAVSRYTLYRLIHQGKLSSINLGTRLTRISLKELETMFNPLPKIKANSQKVFYSMNPDDCYTVGEIARTYHINESTVSSLIRKLSIPMRQIGNYVYIPKSEVDKLFKSI